MTKTNKVKLIYGIALSVLTVVVGVLFIVQAADIYYSATDGTPAYSKEIVAQKLGLLAVPVAIWLVAIIAGVVLSAVYPATKQNKTKQDVRKTVARIAKKLPQDKNDKLLIAFKKWEIVSGVGHIVCLVVCIVAIVFCSVYLRNTANFPAENINAEILKMLANVLPWVAAALAACLADLAVDFVCAKKQLPILKQYLKENKLQNDKQEVSEHSAVALWVVRGIVLAAALTFIVVGIFNGGAKDVLIKAINICTECIGLG